MLHGLPVSFQRAPFAWLAAAWVCGIITSPWTGPGMAASLAAALALLLVSLGALRSGARPAFALCPVLAAFAVAAAGMTFSRPPEPPVSCLGELASKEGWLEREVWLEGKVRSAPSFGPRSARFDMEVDNVLDGDKLYRNLHGGARVSVAGAPRNLYARVTAGRGDLLRVRASLSPLRRYANEGGFDYPAFLRRRGVVLQARVEGPWCLRIVRKAGGVEGFFQRRRRSVQDAIIGHFPGDRTALTDATGGVLLAMATGDRSALDRAEVRRFQETGIFHILAISGLNMSILAFGAFYAMRPFAGVRAAALFAIASVLFYALLVDASSSVLRAALMAVLYFAACLLEQRPHALNAICAAAFFLLVVRPGDLFEAGFQLTFAATLGIIVMGGPLAAMLPRMPLRLEMLLAFSAAAQLATLPIILQTFHRASFAGLLLNLWIVPLTDLLMKSEALFLLAAPWSAGAASALALLCRSLLDAMRIPTEWTAGHAAWLSPRMPPAEDWEIALYGAAILVFAAALRVGRWRGAAFPALGVSLALLLLPPLRLPGSSGTDALDVTMLDVGQGQCVVMEFPSPSRRRPVMLVDAGGAPANRFDVGGNVVAPWLSRRGLRRVDYLVLSTGRTDHCGGAESLLQDFAVGELWLPEAHELGRLGRLAALAKEKGARVRRMHAGMGLETGGATLRVLAPPREGGKRAESDACLVLSLRYGKNSLLLPSDITAGDEKRLLETQGPALSHRVLVLPRHGASTAGSEAFLDAVRPRLALLSVGPNSWRWPSDEALRRCEARGVRVLRSDREGMTSLRFFPEDWNMGWENGK